MSKFKNTYKKPLAFLLALAVMLGLLCTPVFVPEVRAASKIGTVSANVIIRKDKSASSEALATVKSGRSLDVIDVGDTWTKVKTGSITGYIRTKYLTVEKESSSTTTKPATTTAPTSSAPTSTPTSISSSALEKGDEGDAVKSLQKCLIVLGYLKTEATGKFGSATKEAVTAFQKANNLEDDGVAGAKTQTMLLAKVDELAKKQAAANTTTTTTPSTSTSGGTGVTISSQSVSALSNASSIKKGDEGASVTTLQQSLCALGFFNTECTGFFGTTTEAAIKAFQAANALSPDGVAGTQTLQLIAERIKTLATVDVIIPAGEGTKLKQGDEGDAVKTLQKALIGKGYLKSEATGFFGAATYNALMQFQKECGLTADGVAGEKTLAALNMTVQSTTTAPVPAAPSTTSPDLSSITVTELKKGDEKDAVKTLQQALISKGFLSSEVTGFFGTATENALKAFQKASGLTESGVADKATQYALGMVTLPVATVDPVVVTPTTDTSTNNTNNTTSSTSLRKGSEGDAVTTLQNLLIQKGYMTTNATGFFGSATETAVILFQQAAGLKVDGVVGEATLEALRASVIPTITPSADPGDDSAASETQTKPVADTQHNGAVVLEDWWSNKIVNTYKRGETAVVEDVLTGKTFTVSRYGGSNHLDAEPLTAADTATMYDVFNHTWTWSARPIHITINGVTYAAAMNGMPHGGQNITSNNFDGQFCIHFLNSRTHGGNAVNQDMQTQIMVAYNYQCGLHN